LNALGEPNTARRGLALAILLGARALGVGVLMLLLSWGFEIAFAPLGAAALFGLAVLAAASAHVALTRVLGVPRARAGLAFDQRFLQELPLAALVAFCWVGLAMLTISVTGIGVLEVKKQLPHPAMLASGFVACAGLAAFFQITQSSLLIAVDGDAKIRPATLALPSAVAVLAALPFVTAPVALVNTALLTLSTTLLFSREDRREHAIPIGFHAGWLWILVFVTGTPALGVPHDLGLLTWPSAHSVLSGGGAGFESGLVCTFVLAILTGALIRARFLPPDGAPPKDPPSDDRPLPPAG
jgi:hypothetical protein